ncbi:hypothetical protein [Microbacterium indicum]|uniref:hypothetical protein n=1 Tax=Microbacterium indicum TaxID=358100 RepID=UPI0003FF23C1|nr:hypothetical protein [Microbacterium indicum]
MAPRTAHPVAAPLSAPARERSRHLFLRWHATLVLFLALTAGWWAPPLGAAGTGIVAAIATLGTLGIWIPSIARRRGARAFRWRRLPWAAFGFIVVVFASCAWSPDPAGVAIVGAGLVALTSHAIFVADMLTWGEIVRALEIALRWALGGAVVLAIVGLWAQTEWIHEVTDRSPLLGLLAVVALAVFGVRLRVGVVEHASIERILARIAWLVVAAALVVRSGSPIAFAAAALVGAILTVALVMRQQTTPGGRTRTYLLFAALAVVVIVAVRIANPGLLTLRVGGAWETAWTHLGVPGVVVAGVACASFVWRAWFFAVDRPRWDARSDRAFSPLTLAPILVAWALPVAGAAAPLPLILWGWLLIVMFAFAIKVAPVLTHPDRAAAIGSPTPTRGAPRAAEPAVAREMP